MVQHQSTPLTHKAEKPYDPGKLSPNEAELIRLIREKYRFGQVTVVVHDGVPKRIVETVKYESLEPGGGQ